MRKPVSQAQVEAEVEKHIWTDSAVRSSTIDQQIWWYLDSYWVVWLPGMVAQSSFRMLTMVGRPQCLATRKSGSGYHKSPSKFCAARLYSGLMAYSFSLRPSSASFLTLRRSFLTGLPGSPNQDFVQRADLGHKHDEGLPDPCHRVQLEHLDS